MKPPFEGDSFLHDLMAVVVRARNIGRVIETGTETGATAEAFSQWVPEVVTCDVEDKRDRELPNNVQFVLGKSPEVLDDFLPCSGEPILFYLDAHKAPDHTAILEELEIIATQGFPDCVIVIHDFKTDNPSLGWDYYTDLGDMCLELVEPWLARIFPGGYHITFNSDAVGAKRGVGIFWAR